MRSIQVSHTWRQPPLSCHSPICRQHSPHLPAGSPGLRVHILYNLEDVQLPAGSPGLRAGCLEDAPTPLLRLCRWCPPDAMHSCSHAPPACVARSQNEAADITEGLKVPHVCSRPRVRHEHVCKQVNNVLCKRFWQTMSYVSNYGKQYPM